MSDYVRDYTDGCNVYVKPAWTAEWTLREDLICQQLSRSLGHEIDQATFLFRSGNILDVESDLFQGVPLASLIGYYVRIQRTIDPVLDWVGYIIGESQEPMGASDDGSGLQLSGADQVFTAVGMEWFLDRRQIITTVACAGTDEDETRVNRAVGFNTGLGNDREPSQAERGNKDTRLGSSGVASFAGDSANREEWNGVRILQHLLYFHGPSDVDYNLSAPEFIFNAGAYGSYLEWLSPTIQVEGRSVLAILRELISARRGLVWWLRYLPGNNPAGDLIELVVNSVASAAVSLPSGDTLPAAHSQITLDTDADATIADVRISGDRSSQYDTVRVRGARRTATFTLSPADGNLEEGWNTSVFEGLYRTAGGATNAEEADRYRQSERFAHVYSRFLIPQAWDGKTSDGAGGGTFEFCCPDMPQGSTSILGTETFSLHGLRLLRTLPLKAGWDYTDAANPTTSDAANDPPDLMQPLGIVKHGDLWVPLDRAAGNKDQGADETERLKYSYHLRMLDVYPGVEILASGGLNHAIGKNHFDTGSPAPSNVTSEVDYSDMRVTVCAEWDAYCEGRWPIANLTQSPLQELVLYIGDRARLDYLAAGTIFSVENSTIQKCTSGGPLRDDRELCWQLAKVAYEWYAVHRTAFEVTYQVVAEPVLLGNYITMFGLTVPGSGSTLRPANCIVTQITHDFARGKTSISGGFAELDIAGLI